MHAYLSFRKLYFSIRNMQIVQFHRPIKTLISGDLKKTLWNNYQKKA